MPRRTVGGAGAFARPTSQAQAAAWVEGLLKDSGALLIHGTISWWKVMNDWVAALPGDAFIQLLPLLRRTFSTFAPPVRKMIGERAKQGAVPWVRWETGSADFDTARAEAILPILSALLGLDEK